MTPGHENLAITVYKFLPRLDNKSSCQIKQKWRKKKHYHTGRKGRPMGLIAQFVFDAIQSGGW